MTALLDLNVLIALLDPGHVRHADALAWWLQSGKSGWATCPITENGFVRVTTQKAYPNRLPMRDAVAVLRQACAHGGHECWPDDVSLLDASCFRAERMLGPKQVTDAYLLGLAVNRGGRLITFDQGIPITAVQGVSEENLSCLERRK